MSTFYERACKFGQWWQGGALDLEELREGLVLHSANLADPAFIADRAAHGGQPLTSPQLVELDTLLEQRRLNMLVPHSAFEAALWPQLVYEILNAGRKRHTGFTTEALVKAALGV